MQSDYLFAANFLLAGYAAQQEPILREFDS